MDNRLLGIAKKAGFLEIGDESVAIAARMGKAKVILSAADASDGSKRRARGYADTNGTIHLVIPSLKDELGAIIGRGSPGMLTITDVGIASKFVSLLAVYDPVQFNDAAALLAEKAQKLLQRRKEAKLHERNLKTGKRRTKI